MRNCLKNVFLLVGLAALSSCSAVRYQWRDRALVGAPIDATVLPKRLAIVGWSQSATPGPKHFAQTAAFERGEAQQVGAVLARVAADFIKLRRNYLVYDTGVVHKSFVEACHDKVEGVLLVRALDAQAQAAERMHLDLSAELYDCHNGALVWRVEGALTCATHVSELAQLTDSYAGALGEASRPIVAPAFTLLQDLFGTLPDVKLTDLEVEEKIELGSCASHGPKMATRHAL